MANILGTNKERKQFIDQKIAVAKRNIFDTEFVIYQLQSMRESFRIEYDRLGEMIEAAEKRLEEEKARKKPDNTVINQIAKFIESSTKDRNQFKEQMAGVDVRIEGPMLDDKNVDRCHKAQLESLRAVIQLLQDYRNQL